MGTCRKQWHSILQKLIDCTFPIIYWTLSLRLHWRRRNNWVIVYLRCKKIKKTTRMNRKRKDIEGAQVKLPGNSNARQQNVENLMELKDLYRNIWNWSIPSSLNNRIVRLESRRKSKKLIDYVYVYLFMFILHFYERIKKYRLICALNNAL